MAPGGYVELWVQGLHLAMTQFPPSSQCGLLGRLYDEMQVRTHHSAWHVARLEVSFVISCPPPPGASGWVPRAHGWVICKPQGPETRGDDVSMAPVSPRLSCPRRCGHRLAKWMNTWNPGARGGERTPEVAQAGRQRCCRQGRPHAASEHGAHPPGGGQSEDQPAAPPILWV